jgi:hypothetical protein
MTKRKSAETGKTIEVRKGEAVKIIINRRRKRLRARAPEPPGKPRRAQGPPLVPEPEAKPGMPRITVMDMSSKTLILFGYFDEVNEQNVPTIFGYIDDTYVDPVNPVFSANPSTQHSYLSLADNLDPDEIARVNGELLTQKFAGEGAKPSPTFWHDDEVEWRDPATGEYLAYREYPARWVIPYAPADQYGVRIGLKAGGHVREFTLAEGAEGWKRPPSAEARMRGLALADESGRFEAARALRAEAEEAYGYRDYDPHYATTFAEDYWKMGKLLPRVMPGSYHLVVETDSHFFEPFDTSDSDNFKLTAEPDFEAEEVAMPTVKAGNKFNQDVRVFLVPQNWKFEVDWTAYVLFRWVSDQFYIAGSLGTTFGDDMEDLLDYAASHTLRFGVHARMSDDSATFSAAEEDTEWWLSTPPGTSFANWTLYKQADGKRVSSRPYEVMHSQVGQLKVADCRIEGYKKALTRPIFTAERNIDARVVHACAIAEPFTRHLTESDHPDDPCRDYALPAEELEEIAYESVVVGPEPEGEQLRALIAWVESSVGYKAYFKDEGGPGYKHDLRLMIGGLFTNDFYIGLIGSVDDSVESESSPGFERTIPIRPSWLGNLGTSLGHWASSDATLRITRADTGAGSLVGAFSVNGVRRYVWRKTATEGRDGAVVESAPYNSVYDWPVIQSGSRELDPEGGIAHHFEV